MAERWVPQTDRDHSVMAVMHAVRAFSDAMDQMNTGMRGDMEMNATDLAALRMLIMREQAGELVKAHDIARHLGISTASTTKLLDRLSESGHLERSPHPTDRRARVVGLTEASKAEFYRHFGERMARLRRAMDPYSEQELRLIASFLMDTSEALKPDDANASAQSRS